jgi:hypothetical protein
MRFGKSGVRTRMRMERTWGRKEGYRGRGRRRAPGFVLGLCILSYLKAPAFFEQFIVKGDGGTLALVVRSNTKAKNGIGR